MLDGNNITLADIANSEAELVSYLSSKIPGINLRKGSALYDVLIRGMAYVVTLVAKESEQVRLRSSVVKLSGLDDVSSRLAMDNLMSNWFLERKTGELSRGYIILTLSSRRQITLDSSFSFSRNAFSFSIDSTQPIIITEGAYTESIDNGVTTYKVTIPVISNVPGLGGGLTAGSFVVDPPIPSLISAQNIDKFSDIQEAETNRQFLERAKQSVSLRGLVTSRSIQATISDLNIQSVERVLTIKAGDPEMVRDLVAPQGDTVSFTTADNIVNNLFHSLGKADIVIFSKLFFRLRNIASNANSNIVIQSQSYIPIVSGIKLAQQGSSFISRVLFTPAKDSFGSACLVKTKIRHDVISDKYLVSTTKQVSSTLLDDEFICQQTNPYIIPSSVTITCPLASTDYVVSYSEAANLDLIKSNVIDTDLSCVAASIELASPVIVILDITNLPIIKNPNSPTSVLPLDLIKQVISEFIQAYDQSKKLSVTDISRLVYDKLYQYCLGVASSGFSAKYYVLDDRYNVSIPFSTTDYVDIEDDSKILQVSDIDWSASLTSARRSMLGFSNRNVKILCPVGNLSISVVG